MGVKKKIRCMDFNDEWSTRFVNQVVPKECPYCHENAYDKYGTTKSGYQRFQCRSCHRTFTLLTGTIFENSHITVFHWMKFVNIAIREMSQGVSKIGALFLNLPYWSNVLFRLLAVYSHGIRFSKLVWLDDFRIPIDIGDGRGVIDHACIGMAIGDPDRILYKFEGFGRLSQRKSFEAFESVVAENTQLIHSWQNCELHKKLVEKLNLKCKMISPEKLFEEGEENGFLNFRNCAESFVIGNLPIFQKNPEACLDMLTFLINEDDRTSSELKAVSKLTAIALDRTQYSFSLKPSALIEEVFPKS